MIDAAEVKVNLDNEAIKEYIEDEINKRINQQLLLVDVNKLSNITSMSKRWLEEEILSDPRVARYERRKNRKRFYLYEPTIEAILNIVNEW